MLVYPADVDEGGKVAPGLNLKTSVPPTLIVHSEYDKTHVLGSKIYHAARTEAKLPNAYLLYHTGGHGYGLRSTRDAKAWSEAALEWLHKIGIR